jgi:hypothetical protein
MGSCCRRLIVSSLIFARDIPLFRALFRTLVETSKISRIRFPYDSIPMKLKKDEQDSLAL